MENIAMYMLVRLMSMEIQTLDAKARPPEIMVLWLAMSLFALWLWKVASRRERWLMAITTVVGYATALLIW